MNIDDRIKVIMEKMGKLSLKHPEFSCGEFPPRWNAPNAVWILYERIWW